MDINKLNLFNLLGISKKVEKTQKSQSIKNANIGPSVGAEREASGDDSVSISLEGSIKKVTMETQEMLNTVRDDKVKELKDKISSGTYQVNPQDVARAIINGRNDPYEELK